MIWLCRPLASTPSRTVELLLSVVFRGQSGGGVITKLHDRLGGIAGPHEVRKPLEDGHLIPSPSDSPALLYAEEKYNPDDPMEGYLKNKYLVYGARAILLGPSAACSRARSTAKKSGNAHRHGITSISFPFIAYVACLHHFVCMDQETFSAGGASAGWPYAEFYRSILGVVACMSDAQKAGLTKWWNEQVFGGIPREMLAGTVQGEPSQMDRMKAFLRSQNSASAAAASV
ncbi:hypothetical protein EV715DRAFT_296422 [Schizophyllum commune]